VVDISDVTQALAEVITTIVYPNGDAQPSLTGRPVKVYPGWPAEAEIDKDLKAGISHVSIFNMPKMDRDKTNIDDGEMEIAGPAKTYALTLLGQTITVSGAAPNPHHVHNIALGLDSPYPVLHGPAPGDSALQVAADLGAKIAATGVGVTVNGVDITIAAPHRISFARVGVIGSAVHEVSRTEKGWQLTIWAPSPEDRATLGKAIKPALDSVPFLRFANDFSARIKPTGATDSDGSARAGAYCRDLIYTVEVPTTLTVAAPEIVAFQTALQTPSGVTIATDLE
jgi:hypothetical protein